QQLRVAVAVAGEHGDALDPAGLLGPGREHGPALEVRTVRVAVQRVEVVPVEHDVYADLLGLGDRVAQRGVAGMLRLELDADPDVPTGHGAKLLAPRPIPTAGTCSVQRAELQGEH